jgi:hypothetical protein
MAVSTRRVELRIDALVLHGVEPGAQARVADGLTSELTRLLAERGLPDGLAQAGERPSVDAGQLHLGDRSDASAGVGIARALYRGLSR